MVPVTCSFNILLSLSLSHERASHHIPSHHIISMSSLGTELFVESPSFFPARSGKTKGPVCLDIEDKGVTELAEGGVRGTEGKEM